MAQVLRIMLSLTGDPEFVKNEAHVVTELCDIDNEELVHMVGLKKVETVVAVRDLAPRSSPHPADKAHPVLN